MFFLNPYLFSIVGPMIAQIVAAVVPAILLLIYIWRKDKVEKEPPGLLISLVVLGIVSTFGAMLTETLGGLILSPFSYYPTVGYLVVFNFIVVGLSEEGFKYLLLRLRTWKHPAFNYRFDAIVYSVCVSLGFALFENIMYVMQYGLGTAAIRAVTAVPGHACFAVFMGIWYGQAKVCEARGDRAGMHRNRALAVVIPMLVHGAYDFIATIGGGLTIAFIVFVIAMFVIAFRLVRRWSATDAPIPSADAGGYGRGGYVGPYGQNGPYNQVGQNGPYNRTGQNGPYGPGPGNGGSVR